MSLRSGYYGIKGFLNAKKLSKNASKLAEAAAGWDDVEKVANWKNVLATQSVTLGAGSVSRVNFDSMIQALLEEGDSFSVIVLSVQLKGAGASSNGSTQWVSVTENVETEISIRNSAEASYTWTVELRALILVIPASRSLNRTVFPEDIPEEVIEEKPVTKKTTTKKTVKEGE